MLHRQHVGASRPAHRPRRMRLHGKEEARRLFLMDERIDVGADVEVWTRRAPRRRARLLRFLTCGSVDDGKSTLIGRLLYDTKLIFDDQLAALERDSAQARHGRRGHRFRAAGRRAGGRARAGHHHRRRLPLLRHRAALVHRRRHARPRAIYPQHGDRRLQRRPRHHPGRRPQGRADADAPAQLHRLAARHPPCRAGGQQDRPRRLTTRRFSTPSSPTIAASRRSSAFASLVADPDLGALRRQFICGSSATRPGTHGPALLDYLETVEVAEDARREAVPHAGAMGEPAQSRFPRLSPAPSPPGRSRPGDAVAVPPRAGASQVARIVTADGDLPSAAAGRRRDPDACRRDRCLRAATCLRAAAAPAARSPTSSTRTSIWMADEPLLPGRTYLLKLGTRTRPGHGHRAQTPDRRQHARSTAGQDAGLNEVGFVQSSPPTAPIAVRALCAKTAHSAASS